MSDGEFIQLRSECNHCTKCDLSKTRKNVVFGSGNIHADILVIGEAPGANEDEQGLPFVGAAGRNLTKYLEQVGLSRDQVFIANVLKCRPPENRNPTMAEVKVCTPWLYEQIKHINPKVICPLGNFAAKYILSGCNPEGMDALEGISRLHGKPVEVIIHDEKRLVIPLYHPAALIYNRKLEPDMQDDLKTVKREIEKIV